MRTIYILYQSFFDNRGQNCTVGGIQTYIRQLIDVINYRQEISIVVQFADIDFKKTYKETEVFGIDVKGIVDIRKKTYKLLEFVKDKFQKDDIIIFASETICVPTFTDRIIAIQHGITWDRPINSYKYLFLEVFYRSRMSYYQLLRIQNVKNIVCVDYNFINWIRTQVCKVKNNLIAIPNCTEVRLNLPNKQNEKINIIFARRFEEYRGTRLFANVMLNILNKHKNINLTFAGTGPDDKYLKNLFNRFKNVNFITYQSSESLDIHEKQHIAVIPTLGSEGTSLSMLEAMASKCAVIGTNVGGITNIILDHFNGLLVNPEEKQLYDCIDKLIVDDKLRDQLAENAYLTVSKAFNKELWNERWNNVFNCI